jgi:hypothetical protein
LSFYEGVGIGFVVRVGVLKIEESQSEVLCTDSTALVYKTKCAVENLIQVTVKKELRPPTIK